MIKPHRMVASARQALVVAQVRKALACRGQFPPIELENDASGAAEALIQLLQPMPANSPLLPDFRYRLTAKGTIRQMLDGLSSSVDATRVRCARLSGALRIEEAVPWLGSLLGHSNDEVQSAAARALGRLGGARSADALVRALYWRRGVKMRVVLELARSAPDHYLEVALFNPDLVDVRQHIAIAIGLRRLTSSIPALLRLQANGVRNEAAVACRALGSIGDPRAMPALIAALADPWCQVRVAAVKALGRIDDPALLKVLEPLLADRNSDVRTATEFALRHLTRADGQARAAAASGQMEVA